jgi:hypothetical protein
LALNSLFQLNGLRTLNKVCQKKPRIGIAHQFCANKGIVQYFYELLRSVAAAMPHGPEAENTAKNTEYEFAVHHKAAAGEAHRSEGHTQVESLMAVLSVHHWNQSHIDFLTRTRNMLDIYPHHGPIGESRLTILRVLWTSMPYMEH